MTKIGDNDITQFINFRFIHAIDVNTGTMMDPLSHPVLSSVTEVETRRRTPLELLYTETKLPMIVPVGQITLVQVSLVLHQPVLSRLLPSPGERYPLHQRPELTSSKRCLFTSLVLEEVNMSIPERTKRHKLHSQSRKGQHFPLLWLLVFHLLVT